MTGVQSVSNRTSERGYRNSTCVVHPLVKTWQQLVSGVDESDLLVWVHVCYIGCELCRMVRKGCNNRWVACTHGHQERHHRRRAPKLRPLSCGGLSAATAGT